MVRKDLKDFIKTIPENITTVVASKYLSDLEIREMYEQGLTNFGENRTDAFLEKYLKLQDLDITWHFIGHLQRNKCKDVINKIDYLHSLDSLDLAKQIEKYRSTPIKTFIEVSINLEESKNGVPYYEALNFVKEALKFSKIEIVGLMMMAVKGSLNTEEQFAKLAHLKQEIEKELNIKLPYLSMGMSDDYLSAIKAGTTHIRLGRILLEKED